ncbi:MAG: 2-C-methyl-D-erythritol 4-phosphate cytidylyltransferase [Planctomycetales bacterium]|nr:2-C-methyl-D-erythritol 4-phosphate cytidylyltransferase [Planctomycetales bacterium]
MTRFAVILPAAGKSTRFGDRNQKKVFATLAGKPVWRHTVERFTCRGDVAQILLVIAPEDESELRRQFGEDASTLGIEIVLGGEERVDSVRNALQHVREEIEFVAVHDAARPCVSDESIDRVFAAASETGAAILATPIRGTVKRSAALGGAEGGSNVVESTVPRAGLWEAQTPQVFRRAMLSDAYALADRTMTDDAQVVEAAGGQVTIVEGSPFNLKITTRDDLTIAGAVLGPSHNQAARG